MKLIKNDKKGVVYRDYPPVYDVYRRQKVLKNVQAAVDVVLRILYGRSSLCPNLPGVFVDLERFKHMTMSDINLIEYRNKLKHAINSVIPQLNPTTEVYFNKHTGGVTIEVMLYYENEEYAIKFEKAKNKDDYSYIIDRKKFYD